MRSAPTCWPISPTSAGWWRPGVVPSPVGYAHVITSTTHKTLDGPRGAIILTTDPDLAKKIDKAVFPGEQGGPHVHIFAALALTFKLARTRQFEKLQKQTIKNALAMSERFKERGLRVPFGGTNCHMLNVDCRTIKGPDGTTLSGDQAARILDLAGIVVNRNTIPGDKSALDPSGIRLGTPWITQRGFDEEKSRQLADIIADVLLACRPAQRSTPPTASPSGAPRWISTCLNDARLQVRALAEAAGIDFEPAEHGYPHFYYIDDKATTGVFDLTGARVRQFLDYAVSSDLSALKPGKSQATKSDHPHGRDHRHADLPGCWNLPPVRPARAGQPGRHLAARPLGWLHLLQPGWAAGLLPAPPARSGGCDGNGFKRRQPDARRRSLPAQKNPGSSASAARAAGKALPDFKWKER